VDYCFDILKHPRLYLPFLGAGKLALGIGVIGLVLYAGAMLEPPLSGQMEAAHFLLGVAAFFALGLALLGLSSSHVPQPTYQPQNDMQQLGLMASLWRYARAEGNHPTVPAPFALRGSPSSDAAALPNLVVVQSESFFDARRLYAGVRPEVLQQYDRMKASADFHGRLEVPAWGANTVRTEFAFLAAVAPAALGVHQFNPYRKFARRGYPTLAGFLKSLGYRTVCVHPYSASFYNRDKVYPLLGFDEFIDIRSFDIPKNSGPYVSDLALAGSVCALLHEAATQPVFVFVITMENHGPLHLEQVQPGDQERLYTTAPPNGCDELTLYLRHLNNADSMLGQLRERLEGLSRPGWLCWFGDHVPIMPRAYEVVGAPDGKTDYLVWQKARARAPGIPMDLKVENLSQLLVHQMGLEKLPDGGKRPATARA
jgi:Sulfatase